MRTAPGSRIALTTTFFATLFLPIQAAVGIGFVLSLLLQLRTGAMDLKVVELVPRADGRLRERPTPTRLLSGEVTALDVHGSLLYAGARTLQVRLPDPTGSIAPAVELRLRGRTSLGATFFLVMADYTHRLEKVGGRLYLSGVDPTMLARMTSNGSLETSGPVKVYQATGAVGESTTDAYRDADAWLLRAAAGVPERSSDDSLQ